MNYQTKSKWFSMVKMNLQRYWQRLLNSLAKSNESVSLEHSWAWEPAYRRSTCIIGVRKRSLCCVFSRNMDKERLASSSSKMDRFQEYAQSSIEKQGRRISNFLERRF